jgi:hypothetical protein
MVTESDFDPPPSFAQYSVLATRCTTRPTAKRISSPLSIPLNLTTALSPILRHDQ